MLYQHQNRRFRLPKPIEPWRGPKPKLEMTVVQHYRVHFKVLEAYIAKVLKIKGYDIRKVTGARGAMSPEYSVMGLLSNTNNISQQVFDVRCGKRIRNLGLILAVLCLDGFIQPGIYVIDMTENGDPVEDYRKALNDSHDILDPLCLKIKEMLRGNRSDMRRVLQLDQQLMKLQKEQEESQCL